MNLTKTRYAGRLLGSQQRYKLHAIWQNILARTAVGQEDYINGIKMCPQWADFQQFVSDVGLPPAHQYTLFRKNIHRDWCPTNVVWAPRAPLPDTGRKERIRMGKIIHTAGEWAEIGGMSYDVFTWRRKAGWTMEQIMRTPVRKVSRKAKHYIPTPDPYWYGN